MRFLLSASSENSAFSSSPFEWLVMIVLTAIFIALPLFVVISFHAWVFTRSTPPRLFAFVLSYGISLAISVMFMSFLPLAGSLRGIASIIMLIIGAILGASLVGFMCQVYVVASDKIDPTDEILHRIISHRRIFRTTPPQEKVRRDPETPMRLELPTEIQQPPFEGNEFLEPSTGPLELPLNYSRTSTESIPVLIPLHTTQSQQHASARPSGRRSSGAQPDLEPASRRTNR